MPAVASFASSLPPKDTEGLWTLDRAARYLTISPGTLKRYAARGVIETVKIGRLRKFTKVALDKYIKRRTVPPNDGDE